MSSNESMAENFRVLLQSEAIELSLFFLIFHSLQNLNVHLQLQRHTTYFQSKCANFGADSYVEPRAGDSECFSSDTFRLRKMFAGWQEITALCQGRTPSDEEMVHDMLGGTESTLQRAQTDIGNTVEIAQRDQRAFDCGDGTSNAIKRSSP